MRLFDRVAMASALLPLATSAFEAGVEEEAPVVSAPRVRLPSIVDGMLSATIGCASETYRQ